VVHRTGRLQLPLLTAQVLRSHSLRVNGVLTEHTASREVAVEQIGTGQYVHK